MEALDFKNRIVIVAGMHRSGTSLTASLLQSAGVDVGQRLIEATHGNVKGHFENIDFVHFHQSILRSQGVNESGWTVQDEIDIEEQYINTAKSIVAQNSLNPIWGWKDPRATLFLNFWADILPDANFIFVYRSPWEVIDSIYRRSMAFDQIFFEHPDFTVKVWMHYNRKVLDFYRKFSERCLLSSIYSISNNIQAFFDAIRGRFNISLKAPANDIYDQSLLNTQLPNVHRPSLVNHYFPQAIELYQELIACEAPPGTTPDFSWFDHIKTSPYQVWAFHDWLNIRQLETQNKQLTGERNQLQVQLQESQVAAEQSKATEKQSREAVEHLQVELDHTRSELANVLEHSEIQLQQTRTELEQSLIQFQGQLQQTQAELKQTNTDLEQTLIKLEQTQFALTQNQVELEQTQVQLQQTQTELAHTQGEAEQSYLQLKNARLELQNFQAQLQDFQTLVTAMKSSKFWKLRQVWFRLKWALGLKGT